MAEKVVEIGYIVKPHGVKGEVIVALTTNRVERLSPGANLSIDNRGLVVVLSSPHKGRWIVRFEGIDDRNDAELLRGETLYAPPIAEEGEIWIDEIAGLPVYDQDGRLLGKVEALELNPASDLLVLDSGLLVPLVFLSEDVEDYRAAGAVHVTIPEGLIESES